jgi:hypothetical protein
LRVGVRRAGHEPTQAETAAAARWRLLTARFKTSAGPDNVSVFVTKSGEGTAFVDHVALTGVVPGTEPVRPGFAPGR